MRDLMLGQLFRACPYAAPIFPLRDTRESDAEYLEHALSYRRGLDGQLETEADYKLRQVDYITLYAAIVSDSVWCVGWHCCTQSVAVDPPPLVAGRNVLCEKGNWRCKVSRH